jgi:hypothetical protein
MAILATCIALAVAFLPVAIEKVRARRSARPIQVVATPDAGGPACRRPDDTSALFISDVRLIAASPDSAWISLRAELSVPHVESGAVALVTDDEICRSVLAAFNTTIGSDQPMPAPTSLYVAKVGAVYVAMVPAPPDGSVLVHAVISPQFAVLSQYAR